MPNPLHSKHNRDSDGAGKINHFRADGCRLFAGHILLAYARADVCIWMADRLNAANPPRDQLTETVLDLLMCCPVPGVFMPREGLRS
jgi:hypothetical protein